MLAKHPDIETELELACRCGEGLPDVLRGPAASRSSCFFRTEDPTSVARLYQSTRGAQTLNLAVRQTLQTLLRGLPERRGVRILEVGGGTGGLTRSLLPISGFYRTDYVFTDVSSRFTQEARRTFADYPFVRYRVLDVQRDAIGQGFRGGEMDIILAANVLHAATDVRAAVVTLRSLLAPGGALILLEGSRPLGFLDLIFGLTKGWWSFTDTDLRPDHPLLSRGALAAIAPQRRLLTTSATVAAPDQDGVAVGHQAVILARLPEGSS